MIDYDPHQWRTTLFSVRGSMVRVIALRSLVVTVVAVALTAVNELWVPIASVSSSVVHGFIGTALSLLLVFRTNASYDRFWEGRKLWGAMVNTCRNLARAASVHLASRPELLSRVLALTASFPYASKSVLRQIGWKSDGVQADDLAAMRGHLPTAVCQRITAHLDAGRQSGAYDSIIFGSLDANCQQLVDIIGGCERIHKTPLPFAYVVHLRRALVLYCLTLPFALLATFHWYSIGITFVVTYVLLGIEEIGVEIEDPFEGDDNDLPLEDISANIRGNVESYLPGNSG